MPWSYLPHTDADRQAMLDAMGIQSVDELFDDIPEELRLQRKLDMPPALPELELVKKMKKLAANNTTVDDAACFLGAGAYDHFIPSVVDHVISRSEFYTAYTQYQAEISQGYLQALWEYQSMICEITSMDVANASMYDGATAATEGAILACSALRRNEVLVASTLHPNYRAVLETYGRDKAYLLEEIGSKDGVTDLAALEQKLSKKTAAVVIQSPNFFGSIEDLAAICKLAHACGAYVVSVTDPLSLGILEAPGNLGVDIATGECQSLGLPLAFGGPYAGFMAVHTKLMRKIPGRIIGQTVDSNGKRGFVLTLQAREQHIRREKATSNICSNEALCALSASVYMAALGKDGFRKVATQCYDKAHYAFHALCALPGCRPVFTTPFYQEFVLHLAKPVAEVNKKLLSADMIGGLDLGRYYPELDQCMLLCVTEKRTKEEIDRLVREMEAAL